MFHIERFPLTLTLSLGEREQLLAVPECRFDLQPAPSPDSRTAGPAILPLPEGEGRGEG